jgi:ABC-type amino acid transport substrate-binding protein
VPYLPEDLLVGGEFNVWCRKFVIYDCDDFTRSFYKEYLGIDQAENKVDVEVPPIKHTALPPPPHNGIGREEDSLLNVLMVRPVPPKQDLVRLMTLSGEILRFECKMVNGSPEDEIRKLVVGYFPADDQVAVWEIPGRNSGFVGGPFCKKTRMKNVDTGTYFAITDFAVGKYVTVKAHPLLVTRADEHALQYLEAHPEIFPYADPMWVASRLAPCASIPQFGDPAGIEPDMLKEMAAHVGVDLIDHEIITLLRFFGVDEMDGVPAISGQKILAAIFGDNYTGEQ